MGSIYGRRLRLPCGRHRWPLPTPKQTHCNTQVSPTTMHMTHLWGKKKKKGNKKHSVERRIGRKSEKSRRCQDQEDEEVRRRSSRAGNMYVQTAGVFPEGTTSHEGSTLQKICFPRGLSPMEALELEKIYEEGMAKMKFWTNCKCNIPHPALPVASRQ